VNVVACICKYGSQGTSVVNLPASLCRRLNPFSRRVMEVLYESLEFIGQEAIPWVASCRHGDQARTLSLLSDVANKELLLPTDFSFSVHNAIMGMFSIVTNNKSPYTTLSGGNTSFISGLLEAMAIQIESGNKVGYIYYDAVFSYDHANILEEESSDICVVLLLDKEKYGMGEVNFYYKNSEKISLLASKDSGIILALIDFLNGNEKNYEISVPGGQLLFTRHS
jgi:hypothetical protein